MLKRKCFICGGFSNNIYPLCNNCKPMPLSKKKICEICGIPTSVIVNTCSSCDKIERYFVYNYSLFYYSGIPKEILTQYKFKKDISYAHYYSGLIAMYVKKRFDNPIICPVPTSYIKRKIKNGYHLDSIIYELKKRNLDVRYLLKKRYSRTQKKLNKLERQINLSNSFTLRKSTPNNSIIILFDDVFTTGATINECAKLLRKMNNVIYSITLCRD